MAGRGVALTDPPAQQSLSPEGEAVFLQDSFVLSLKQSPLCRQRRRCRSAGGSAVPGTCRPEGLLCPSRYSPSAGEKTSVPGTLSIPRSFVLMPFPTAAL